MILHSTPKTVDLRGRKRLFSHLMSDLPDVQGREELVAFAGRIGLRREWMVGENVPRFELLDSKVHLAADSGSTEITEREMVRRCIAAFEPRRSP